MLKNKRINLYLLLLLICLVFVVISQSKIKETQTGQMPAASQKTSQAITILATGDILMHNTVIAAGFSNGQYNYDTIFSPVKDIITSSDYALINLEAALAGADKGYTGYPLFNAPDSLAAALKNSGFDLVTNANNHILDRGYDGAIRTLDILRQNGLDTLGVNKSLQEKETPLIKDIKGIKVGFLAYGYDTNGIPLPADKPYFYNLLDEDKILQDIAAMRPLVDVLVLNLHWGVEYSPYPTEKQVEQAHKYLAQGADVIFGGHPHVLQPAEIITVNGKKKYIVYSMGNILGDQRGVERNSGVIVKLTFEKNLLSGETELKSYDYTPTFSNSYIENGKKMFRVIPVAETIQRIKAGQDPYLNDESLPLLEKVLQDCDEKMR